MCLIWFWLAYLSSEMAWGKQLPLSVIKTEKVWFIYAYITGLNLR